MAGGAERAVVLDQRSSTTCSRTAPRSPAATSSPRSSATSATASTSPSSATPIDADALLPGMVPLPREEPEGLVGEVLWVDHFGNCQLNVGPDEIAGWGHS